MRITAVLKSSLMLALALPLFGCGEPTREDYRDEAAETYCDRADECGNIGDGQDYETVSDCVIDQTDLFNEAWPADECGNGRINETQFDSCVDRLEVVACDGNFFDQLSALDECRAGNVCTN
ncbi:hypothetical protein FRC96_00345 [Lujinxingia vulgaris]|uniref:Lipoprotein n=1 Tax=Lujinxingia vulgaris TaxID=2600176 RepID=A0A5C6XP94_9DELT|nr:DUF6184 family natural product biosynthesis lipoprotein [Lujinxingia vulgaris]TXD44566.1 hypothetical protein FRC96_00345 [Lujinxingia vulgaris]